MLVICTSTLVKAEEKPASKVQALDVGFLLYIADMDKIEQQWLGPIEIENLSFEQDSKAEDIDKDTYIEKNIESKNESIEESKKEMKTINKETINLNEKSHSEGVK